jgi:hypothetical protein
MKPPPPRRPKSARSGSVNWSPRRPRRKSRIIFEFAQVYDALRERLDEDSAYQDLSERPLREIVERLCKDLMISPDWSRWDGEGWIKQEGAPKRTRYSIFNQPSALPLLDDDDPEESEAEPPPGPRQNGHVLE